METPQIVPVNYYNLLDTVLSILKRNEGKGSHEWESEEMNDNNLTPSQYHTAVQKLQKEGYVGPSKELTLEGYIFIQDGMYAKKNYLSALSERDLSSRISQAAKNEERLAHWSVILGILTGLLFVLETIVHWKELKQFFCPYCI